MIAIAQISKSLVVMRRPAYVPSDANVASFITATAIAEEAIMQDLDTLIIGIKALNSGTTWSKFFAMYPMVGGNATAHSYNIVNTANHQITWSGGLTHANTGVTSNGTTGYGNTGIIPSTHETAGSACFCFYSRTDVSSSAMYDLGCYDSVANDGSYMRAVTSAQFRADLQSSDVFGSQEIAVSNTNSTGFYWVSRTSATQLDAYKAGSNIGSNTNSANTRIGNAYYLLALNQDNVAVNFSTRECAFAAWATGITSSEVSSIHTLVQSFQTSRGRNV